MNNHLQRALDAIDFVTSDMTAADLLAHPEGKWTAAEILEHLSRAYSGTSKALERCLESGSPRTTRPSMRQRVWAFIVVRLGHLPAGRQAPEHTRPRGLPPEAALAAARDNLVAMDGALERAAGRFGQRAKVMDHPILGAFSIPQWQKFHWVHTRHHIGQIERLKKGSAPVPAR